MATRPLGASTGVQLHTSEPLQRWREQLSKPTRAGVHAPIDWMLALEALSDTRTVPSGRHLVRLTAVASALGEGDGTAREGGAIYNKYTALWESYRFQESPDPDNTSDAITRLYRQARVATFLEFREGFVEHLAAVPFSAEVALHGYLRLAVEWAIRWRGLTLATPSERESSRERYRSVAGRNRQQQAKETERSWVAVPMTVEDDVRALLKLSRLEAGDVTSASDLTAGGQDWQSSVAVDAILEQLKHAITQVLVDPTITALTASNTVRQTANVELGGALQRIRARAEDQHLIEQKVLDQVYKLFVEPIYTQTTSVGKLRTLASAEDRFNQLRIAVTGFVDRGTEE